VIDNADWTSWEKVTVDISGTHLIPVVWRRRLYLFWPIMVDRQIKSDITLPSSIQGLPVGDSYWEIKLAWTERKEGKWLAKTISDDFITCWKSAADGLFDERTGERDPERTRLTFRAYTDPIRSDLQIKCIQNLVSPNVIGYFAFDGIRGNPKAVISERAEPWLTTQGDFYIMTPTNTVIKNMTFSETSDKNSQGQWLSDGKLWAYMVDFPTGPLEQTADALSGNNSQRAVLNKTPEMYSIIPPHQDGQFSSQRPLFSFMGNGHSSSSRRTACFTSVSPSTWQTRTR
jgi:hypothetical protein